MSIHNDVRFTCPHCARLDLVEVGSAHIPQVIAAPTICTLSDLRGLRQLLEEGAVTPSELKQVAKCAASVHFKCRSHASHVFEADAAYLIAIPLIADRYVEEVTAGARQRAERLFKEVYPD